MFEKRLSDEKIEQIARDTIEQLGLVWKEPVLIKTLGSNWIITTNRLMRGGNLKVYIDRRSLKVVKVARAGRVGTVFHFYENGEHIVDE